MYVIRVMFELITSEFREVSLIEFVPRVWREKRGLEDGGTLRTRVVIYEKAVMEKSRQRWY